MKALVYLARDKSGGLTKAFLITKAGQGLKGVLPAGTRLRQGRTK